MLPVTLIYDMRAPDFGVAPHLLYEAALDQAEWADRLGLEQISLLEHHATSDGYLPSPLVMGGAVAARTKNILIGFTVILLPLYDHLKLAEDIAVLDLISKGRVRLTFGAGYRPEEYAQFDRDIKKRPSLMEEGILTLQKAWTGEPFDYKGRTVRILPRPYQKPRPRITMGGAAPASAKRAARIADNYAPVSDVLYDIYLEELKVLGKPKPIEPRRNNRDIMSIHISENVERDWPRVAPHYMHDINEYGRWTRTLGAATSGMFAEVTTVEELRAKGSYLIVTPEECVKLAKEVGHLNLRPLTGGLPPEIAWESLKLFETKVLPKLG